MNVRHIVLALGLAVPLAMAGAELATAAPRDGATGPLLRTGKAKPRLSGALIRERVGQRGVLRPGAIRQSGVKALNPQPLPPLPRRSSRLTGQPLNPQPLPPLERPRYR